MADLNRIRIIDNEKFAYDQSLGIFQLTSYRRNLFQDIFFLVIRNSGSVNSSRTKDVTR